MTDIPIIYSGPMVRGLWRGDKTQTRRLAWREVPHPLMPEHWHMVRSAWTRVKVGDRLWVRESFRYDDYAKSDLSRAIYRADAPATALRETNGTIKWKPAIHMPRPVSRITLIVTDTKIERLQAISDADAKAEGIVEDDGSEPDIWYVPGAAAAGWKIQMAERPAAVFRSLWIALHGEGAWMANPEVVAISFRVIRANIDAPAARVAA